jgi:excisionase family DNA binding protein
MLVQMFSEREAAELLSVSVSVLKKWRYKGRLPYYKLAGGPVRYSEDQLSELMSGPQCKFDHVKN